MVMKYGENASRPHEDFVSFKITSRILQIASQLMKWPHVNIRVMESYGDKGFCELLSEVLCHFLVISIESMMGYPMFVIRCMAFLESLFLFVRKSVLWGRSATVCARRAHNVCRGDCRWDNGPAL
jgi:hypothetical protein